MLKFTLQVAMAASYTTTSFQSESKTGEGEKEIEVETGSLRVHVGGCYINKGIDTATLAKSPAT